MQHLAILRKSWKLAQKILSGEKKIESRWYNAKYAPWDRIKKGDIIYFKNSGEPVTIKAEVRKVIQFSGLTPSKVRMILDEHHSGLGIPKATLSKFVERFKNKNYCVLIFLNNPQKIKPFDIDKKGFGLMSAWITIDDLNKIKR
ncbi:MAG: hypothetical protein KKF46_04010 [Nanoarchaeota archaeon]|nr:hypothetical protein [Nanoarchaeota archaeon]MBU1321499.1 hypothetical protein [Nanoarchaeota archaeon]MBU1597383.1 hypothetical protein [Nanoarchaeota archaeon]MBU2441204.1 hypothetical protein [Nanoarchaeota archaeon]